MTPTPRLAGILLLAMALAGPAAGQGFFDRLGKGVDKSLGLGSDENKQGSDADKDKRTIDSMQANPGACGGDGRASLLNAKVDQGLGVIDSAALADYLNAVLAKLVAASPKPDCNVRVFVTPHDSVQAVALADGGILVGIGFLRNLKSEDEVACLLGHELSHILKNHHSSDSFVDTQDELLKGLDAANTAGAMFAGTVDPTLSGKIATVSDVGTAVHSVSEGLIAPVWTSEQEDEADLLGSDLCSAAGYNPRAMASVLEVIAAHEAANAQVDEERKRLQNEKLKETVVESARSTNTSDTWSLIANAAKVTTAAVGSMASDKREHRPASERKESVNGYVRDRHGAERRRKFAVEAWERTLASGASGAVFDHYRDASEARRLAYTGGDLKDAERLAKKSVDGDFSGQPYPRLAQSEVRLKQGDEKGAEQSLNVALKNPDAPWQIYRSLADLHLYVRDVKAATETVARADATFGEPLGIAPFAIKVYRAAGDRQKVLYYLDRCDRAGKRAHLEVCLASAGMTKEQYQQQRLRRGG